MTRHTADVVAAAMKGHPDSLTALKILTESLEDAHREAQLQQSTWGPSAPRLRKFRKGPEFFDVRDLVEWLDKGGWVYQGTKPQHPTVIANMSLHTLRGFVARGGFARAIRNPEPATVVDPNEPPF